MVSKRSHLAVARTLAGAAVAATLVTLAVAQTDQQRAPVRPTLFSAPLLDAPGKELVVVELNVPPKSTTSAASSAPRGHRHPGSVYVYVTHGALRLGIERQPVQVVSAGGSFFEPVGALHTVMENVSATEPARAIAVMIVPDGAPLVTAEAESRP